MEASLQFCLSICFKILLTLLEVYVQQNSYCRKKNSYEEKYDLMKKRQNVKSIRFNKKNANVVLFVSKTGDTAKM